MAQINEDTVEYVAIDWLREIGYDYVHGGEIAPGEPAAERDDYREVLLLGRLRRSLAGINGHLPRAVRADVIAKSLGHRCTAHHDFHLVAKPGFDNGIHGLFHGRHGGGE